MAAEHDVIIIGAGVSGLAAANVLAPECSVLILEGGSKAGGRLRSETWSGSVLEWGANWIHGTNGQNPVHEIAMSLGLQGRQDDRKEFEHVIDALTGKSLADSARARRQVLSDASERLERMVTNDEHVDSDEEPETASPSGEHDFDCSVRAGLRACGWIPSEKLDDALEWLDIDFEYADSPSELSVHHNIREEFGTADFGESSMFVTDTRGFETLAIHLADTAIAAGASIVYNTTVNRIDATAGVCSVHAADGAEFKGRRVIVTASLGVLQSGLIKFDPELPLPVLRDLYSIRFATYTKVFVKWPRRWWKDGSSGSLLGPMHTLLVGERRGQWPLLTIMAEGDGSGRSDSIGDNRSTAILCATVVGEEARRIEASSDEEVQAALHAVLVRAFPSVTVPPPSGVRVCRWGTNPLHRGAYSFLPTGALPEGWRNLQQPLCDGRVWLAGEAMHEKYSGYLHGALLSGREVAERLLARNRAPERPRRSIAPSPQQSSAQSSRRSIAPAPVPQRASAPKPQRPSQGAQRASMVAPARPEAPAPQRSSMAAPPRSSTLGYQRPNAPAPRSKSPLPRSVDTITEESF